MRSTDLSSSVGSLLIGNPCQARGHQAGVYACCDKLRYYVLICVSTLISFTGHCEVHNATGASGEFKQGKVRHRYDKVSRHLFSLRVLSRLLRLAHH